MKRKATVRLNSTAATMALLVAAAQLAARAAAIPTAAPPADPAAPPKPPSLYDKIWKYTEWYANENNPVIQSFRFTGRFQLDYAYVDAEQGEHDEWNIRRFRLGAKMTLFKHLTFHGEADLNPQEPHPAYQKLTDFYLAWSRSKDFALTMGKQSAGFTLDGMTSSKELLTIDRCNLANNLWFPEEYFSGVSASGRPGHWVYRAGVYSSGRTDEEFGEFNGSFFGLGTLGYDFAEHLRVKKAVLAVNFVYNDPDPNNTVSRQLERIGSINFNLDAGKWGVRTDFSAGAGYGQQSDLWGAMVMPYYNLTDRLQVVARYTHVTSDEVNGVRLARYESELVSGRGDEYNEFYLGLNYYFYNHKLKVQTGVQYADMRDRANDGGAYSGWGWTTGLRISW